ncbi:ribosomal protein S5 domain 2-type protein [Bisporella sp. PMI_857]|nr:ribosomal protein S5 domain 2-type protein [Bisporella sp. PMI_857]
MKSAWLPAGLPSGLRCAYTPRPIFKPFLRNRNIKPSRNHMSTSSRLQAGIAAPEIRFEEIAENRGRGRNDAKTPFYARLVPDSPSYFTAQPHFIDDLLTMQQLAQKYASLPRVKPVDAPRVSWVTLAEYRDVVNERVGAAKYQKILEILARLNCIHHSVMPQDVVNVLNQYKRNINPFRNVAKPTPIDEMGRALGHGRRKTSTARAWVVEGTGEVLVNGKTLAEAFSRIHDRESAIWGLKATDRIDKYNVWALVEGGGTTGQAEALTLAIAKALISHEPALKPALRRAGCITRDPRRVERKKPGHVKARKKPAWVKR